MRIVRYVELTPPAVEPVSLAEMKDHLRIDDDDENAMLNGWIRSARQQVETTVSRPLVTRTFKAFFDSLPSGEIRLPMPPLRSVSSIAYTDLDGSAQTVSAADYTVDAYSEPGRITRAYDVTWPSSRVHTNSASITFVAGIVTPFTVDAGTNTLTAAGRSMANGDVVEVSNRDGALPGNLSQSTPYYVVNTTGASFQLSLTSGGSAIDVTDAGEGTHFIGALPDYYKSAIKLIVGHTYENREAVVVNQGFGAVVVPMGVASLLQTGRWEMY